jgi:hypothetical protein
MQKRSRGARTSLRKNDGETMRKSAAALALISSVALLAGVPAHAGELSQPTAAATESRETALDLFRLDSSYTFESTLENAFGPNDDQHSFYNSLEYSHRFLLSGRIFLRAGLGYERFDFNETTVPVPEYLQSTYGLVGLEYMVGNDVGAFLYLRPGFYTEDRFDISSFDIPVTLGRVFVLQPDRLYLVAGATGAGLRGQFPVLPIGGLIWKPADRWNVFLVPPEPRVSYAVNRKLDVFVNGQLIGGSFRTHRDTSLRPSRLRNAALDYTEYRAGAGLEYRCTPTVSVAVNGGYTFQRRFNFERAGEDFEADAAPFVRVAVKADF